MSPRTRWIQIAVVAGVFVVTFALIFPAIDRARDSARRSQSKNNLHNLGLALHNYHETFRCLPPGGTFDSESRGHHGWVTLLLPFIDANPYYNQINFNEPWDSPRNSAFAKLNLPVLRNPDIESKPNTGQFRVSHYSANSHLMAANSSIMFSEVESTSNTFMAGELAGDFVPWSCPYNWRPFTGFSGSQDTFGRPDAQGAHFLLCDGNVRWIKPGISSAALEALRGPDLARHAAGELKIVRPKSFPVPTDVWTLDHTKSADGFFAMRDGEGEFVELTIGGGKSGREASDRDLPQLLNMKHLKKLRVDGQFTDEGLRLIAQVAGLEELALNSDQISDAGLLHLSGMESLAKLAIVSNGVSPRGVADLRKMLPNCAITRHERFSTP